MSDLVQKERHEIVAAAFSQQLQSLQEAEDFANKIAKSDFVPAHLKDKPGNVLVAAAHGMEVGLTFMQSLQQVVPINGLPTIKGDGAKGLILNSGLCDKWDESYEGEGDDLLHKIVVKRKNTSEQIYTFSVQDAKKAGLWDTRGQITRYNKFKKKQETIDNPGPWYRYPKRMLRYRNVGFVARDVFPDVMGGLTVLEEATDMPKTIDAQYEEVKTEHKGQEVVLSPEDDNKTEKIATKALSSINKNKTKSESQPEEATPLEEIDWPEKLKGITKYPLPESGERVIDISQNITDLNEVYKLLKGYGLTDENVIPALKKLRWGKKYTNLERLCKLAGLTDIYKVVKNIET